MKSFDGPLTRSRRAKIKNIAKKSIEDGGDCNDIPESMRRYLALQAMESGKSIGTGFLGRAGGSMAPYGSGMLLNTDTSSSKVGEFQLEMKHYESQRVAANLSQSSTTSRAAL